MVEYGYKQQAKRYREAAWDRGCICPILQPHVHLLHCPLYRDVWASPAEEVAIVEGIIGHRLSEKDRIELEEDHAAHRYIDEMDRQVHDKRRRPENAYDQIMRENGERR